MTNQSNYQKWVKLADKRPWDIGDRHDFCELSLKLASKVEKLVEAVKSFVGFINSEGGTYIFNDMEKALKELTGE